MEHVYQCSIHGRWRVRVPDRPLGGGLRECHIVRAMCPSCEAEARDRLARSGNLAGTRGMLVVSLPCICDTVTTEEARRAQLEGDA